VGPVVLVSVLGKTMGGAAPAGMSTDANVIRALKAEEASINARLESARKEIGRVDDLKSQQNFLESQIEAMRKMQFEETYKLEGLQKETATLAGQVEDRKKSLGESPAEITANLSQQDQELVSKIENHKKEELLLARKIEEIRKKVIDLDRRIEARRKEEADIANRIEVKKREEQALNQRMGG
jgi:chromosome segregation ATPase